MNCSSAVLTLLREEEDEVVEVSMCWASDPSVPRGRDGVKGGCWVCCCAAESVRSPNVDEGDRIEAAVDVVPPCMLVPLLLPPGARTWI